MKLDCAGAQVSSSILPVTALCFIPDTNLILAGRGSWICLYDHVAPRLVWKRKVFQDCAIHGFVRYRQSPVAHLLLVWGGRSICTLKIVSVTSNGRPGIDSPGSSKKSLEPSQAECSTPGLLVLPGRPRICSDWILDCTFSSSSVLDESADFQAVAITAHNALIGLRIYPGNGSERATLLPINLSQATRCMLYSAHLQWSPDNRIYIAAGTAFGTVIVWSFTSNKINESPRIATHHVFMAHSDGSVFGVCLFSLTPLVISTHTQLYVATCSDDRTIKVWTVSIAPTRSLDECLPRIEPYEEPNDTQIPQCSALIAPGSVKSRHGHISRVWHISILDEDNHEDNRKTLVSSAEDATCQLWCITRKAAPAGVPQLEMAHIRTLQYHAGKNTWSVASNRGLIATGGADGRIALQRMSASSKSSLQQLEPSLSGAHLQSFKSCAFVSYDSVLAANSEGGVILITNAGSEDVQQLRLGHWETLRNYSVAVSIPDLGLGFVAGSRGEVYGLAGSSLLPCPAAALANDKIGGLFAHYSPSTTDCPATKFSLLVTSLRSNFAVLSRLDCSSHPENGQPGWAQSENGQNCRLQLATDFVVTSMILVSSSTGTNALFLGSRDGRIAEYRLPSTFTSTDARPCSTVIIGHKDAVTSMLWHSKGNSQYGHMLSTSRDGTYCVHTCSIAEKSRDPTLVHQAVLPFGPYIEGAYVNSKLELCFFGFQSEDFVVYNATMQQELARIDCGGSHRVWAFLPSRGNVQGEEMRFAWNRASTFHVRSMIGESYNCIQPGGHGREIKSCAISPTPHMIQGTSMHLIATGAEDTDVRLFSWPYYDPISEVSTPRCVATLRKHDTGIQQIRWSDDGRYLFTCGGREELFVWRIQPTAFAPIGVVCESRMPPGTDLSDLRLMDFEVRDELGGISGKTTKTDASFLITMVFSNAVIQTCRYSRAGTTSHWELLSTTAHGDHCLTVVRHLAQATITAGTNGYVSVWREFDAGLALQTSSRIHQNTVKDLVSVCLESSDGVDPSYLLLSVGDDNALGITRLSLPHGDDNSATPASAQVSSLLVPKSHAASATGIALLSRRRSCNPSEEVLRIVTTANDQRVKMWDISIDPKRNGVQDVNIRLVKNLASDVADTSSLSVFPTLGAGNDGLARILVCGVGMETWNLLDL